jgi:hypothetical protein
MRLGWTEGRAKFVGSVPTRVNLWNRVYSKFRSNNFFHESRLMLFSQHILDDDLWKVPVVNLSGLLYFELQW